MSAPRVIAASAVAVQIALGPSSSRASRAGMRPAVLLGRRNTSAAFLLASGATALAFIGAGAWSFDWIVRDRRAHDWS
ncbi:MAG: hypothetical protein WC729_14635 [Sphingomonas sp.]|jgi:hypothetical protein|uniref:hypothetical protein n=1 Tax=Sphingomonas sp. TaxID=28214 RepID=UPI0035683E83